MKEQFVTYEIALKLKKLGFDSKCIAKYTRNDKDELFHLSIGENCFDFLKNRTLYGNEKNYNIEFYRKEGTISAPIWQEVTDWLRDVNNLHVSITLGEINKYYWFTIIDENTLEVIFENELGILEYPEAREQAILKALELIKKK